jgi:hypothetical protein
VPQAQPPQTITGDALGNFLVGGDNADVIQGMVGNDQINGGGGDDYLDRNWLRDREACCATADPGAAFRTSVHAPSLEHSDVQASQCELRAGLPKRERIKAQQQIVEMESRLRVLLIAETTGR